MTEKDTMFILGDVREMVRTKGAHYFWGELSKAFPDTYRLLRNDTPEEKLAALLR